MKSELKRPSEAIKFPRLAKHKNSPQVVLFTSETSGVCVQANAVYDIGRTDEDWVRITDSSCWEILPAGSQVILTQD